MSEGPKKKTRCSRCVFRADPLKIYKCNYEGITGHTRKGQPPEECTYFKEGARIDDPHKRTKAMTVVRRRRKPGGGKPKYNWDRALELYLEGKNDGEIGREIGCAAHTVNQWRHRVNLIANVKRGGRGKEIEKDDA